MAADPTRRVVLAATAALPLLVTGCKGIPALATPPKPLPDVVLLHAAISAERLMVGRYEAAIRVAGDSHPDLASVLPALLAQHRQHLAQLRTRLIVPVGAAGTPARGPAVPQLPAAADLVVAYLRGAEQDAVARLQRQMLAAPPALAQLLASISAAEATHVPVLAAAAGSAGRPAQATSTPAQTTSTPAQTTSTPAQSATTPAQSARTPAQTTTTPAQTTATTPQIPTTPAQPATAPAPASPAARRPDSQAVGALQAALQAEQAASYGYGVLGAHLSGRRRAAAAADWVAHQRARDALEEMLRSRGVTPAPAAVAYSLPISVRTGREAVSLAVLVEQGLTAAYLGMVALGEPALRILGAQRMQTSALRAARWRGSTVAFPGMPASGFAGLPARAPAGLVARRGRLRRRD